jgi:hypothetical protein
MGLGALKPLEAAGKLFLLMSRPMSDLVGKVAGSAVPRGSAREPLSIGGSGLVLLCPNLG